uniref:extracellular calcium-sensing receptor-like n=1 Tax=Myxine glutinosa TaxID=7769 RepID=UPI00358FDBE6
MRPPSACMFLLAFSRRLSAGQADGSAKSQHRQPPHYSDLVSSIYTLVKFCIAKCSAIFPRIIIIVIVEVPLFIKCRYCQSSSWAMAVFNTNSFRSVMTMIYAVDEINRNSSILPNTSLGYMIYDSCFNMHKTLTAAISFLGQKFSEDLKEISYFASCRCLSDKQQFPSFLRTVPSDAFQAIAIAKMFLHFGWVYIGTFENDDDYGREGDEIANTKAKVILAFTSVSDFTPFVAEMLQRNITNKQWIASESWIQSPSISSQNHIHMVKGTIGFAPSWGYIPVSIKMNHKSADSDVLRSKTKFTDEKENASVNIFLLEFWEYTFGCTWTPNEETSQLCTGTESIEAADTKLTDVSRLRVTYNTYMAVYAIAKALHNLQYCVQVKGILLNVTCGDILSFEPWQLDFLPHTLLSLTLGKPRPSRSLERPALKLIPWAYHFTIADRYMLAASSPSFFLLCCLVKSVFDRCLQNVEFINNLGNLVKFDKNGDPFENSYELINWQLDERGQVQFKVVGEFKSSAPPEKQLHIFSKTILWNDVKHRVPRSLCSEPCQPGSRRFSLKGEPFCCFDCIPCTDGQYSNTTDSVDCQHCPEDLWSNTQRSTCFPMPREFLAFSDPLALTLLAFAALGITAVIIVGVMMVKYRKMILVKSKSVFHYVLLVALASNFTTSVGFVGEPTDLSCQWRESVALGLITFSIICVLTKAYDILVNSQDSESCNNPKRRCSQPKVLLVLCSIPQTAFSVAWAVLEKPQAHKNLEYRLGTVVLECVGASPLWVSCALCYLGVLVISCLLMALKGSKRVPGSSEPRFIIFSMLFFCMVCVAFVPAYSSTQGKFTVAVEIFAIIVIVYGLLGFAFTCVFDSRSARRSIMAPKRKTSAGDASTTKRQMKNVHMERMEKTLRICVEDNTQMSDFMLKTKMLYRSLNPLIEDKLEAIPRVSESEE